MARVYATTDIPKQFEHSKKPEEPKKGNRHSILNSITSLPSSISHIFSREEGNFTLGCTKLFKTRTRFLVMVNVLLCLASVWSNILAFNFALVCFNHEPEENVETTEPHPTFFTSKQSSFLTSIVAASALVSNFIVVQLVSREIVFSTQGERALDRVY